MSTKPSIGHRQAQAARREQLLDEFERSGLSAAEFARRNGLTYTTFCGWRKRWEKAKALPSFVQVEVGPCAGTEDVVIEAGTQAWMRINRTGQIGLAAALIEALNRKGFFHTDVVVCCRITALAP
ncbi:MAG TPA: hypothetical protein VGY56_21020 [Verrucomicrobiae bacterium]|nr:hypothetical protein [Verrucomicrobiae bacterium]